LSRSIADVNIFEEFEIVEQRRLGEDRVVMFHEDNISVELVGLCRIAVFEWCRNNLETASGFESSFAFAEISEKSFSILGSLFDDFASEHI